MKSTPTSLPSPNAVGSGYDRAATPNYDAWDRPAIVPDDGITVASHDYDGLGRDATVTVCRNIPTTFYVAASAPFSGDFTCEDPRRIAETPRPQVAGRSSTKIDLPTIYLRCEQKQWSCNSSRGLKGVMMPTLQETNRFGD